MMLGSEIGAVSVTDAEGLCQRPHRWSLPMPVTRRC